MKWLLALEGDASNRRNPFQGMHMMQTEMIRILLRDLWEDLVAMKWVSDDEGEGGNGKEGEEGHGDGDEDEQLEEERMEVEQEVS